MSKASSATGKGAFAGVCGATMSTRCAWVMALPASFPSRTRRAVNLRPIMPAAPMMSTFIQTFSLRRPAIPDSRSGGNLERFCRPAYSRSFVKLSRNIGEVENRIALFLPHTPSRGAW